MIHIMAQLFVLTFINLSFVESGYQESMSYKY